MSFENFYDDRPTYVTRVILGASINRDRPSIIKSLTARNGLIVNYKAASNRVGTTRNFSQKRQQFMMSQEEKSAIRSIARSLASIAIPGDISPFRSPIRSGIYRAITPGKPSPSGSFPARSNRAHRCPEGFQYGGRFTNSRLSTCGIKLFDIPSPLGAAIANIRRAIRVGGVDRITGEPLGGLPAPGDPTIRRDPNVQIPKVGTFNRALFLEQIEAMIKGLSSTKSSTSRMVRQDGFILQPIVPARVLRAIPDNRDMEGASYLVSVRSPKGFGKDEVGLLSNTGVNSVVYVMPGGSTISLSKARKLTVGERRKLGKTIRAAESEATASNPTGNMKYISEKMGDGIAYSEFFVNIKNPNEILNGKPKWVGEIFSRNNIAKNTEEATARETVSNSPIGKKIKSIDEAMIYLSQGGNLSGISPEILAKVLTKKEAVQTQKINNKQSIIVVNGQKYVLYSPSSKYAHLAERFSSDVQQYLRLESPDVLMVGPGSDKRKYLIQSVETALPGSVFNPNAKMSDFKPEDVAKMMISDFLTDQRKRDLSSVYALTTPDGEIPMFAQNESSGLIDLNKIEITKRMKMSISDFYDLDSQIDYSEYYQALKIEQQLSYRRFIEQLITRAKSFRIDDLKRRLKSDGDGISPGEIAHIEIMEKIYDSRLAILASSKKMLTNYLKGM